MVCGTCGATIADKAIVCYRCGTATALPPVPGRPTPAPARRPWAIVGLLAAVAAAAAGFAIPVGASIVPDPALWTVAGVSAAAAALLAMRR